MSNTFILWAILVLPWLSLFFMKKDELRRYFPVGIFTSLLSIVIVDIGSTLNLWILRENIYPLSHLFPYHLGVVPIVTMWLFKFTYGSFLKYITVDAIINLIFAFLVIPWFAARGIRENIGVTDLELFIIVTIEGVFIYVYQILQEGLTLQKSVFGLQTAATKPHFDDEDK